MPSDHPHTPESPSQLNSGAGDRQTKTSTSPHFTNSLPTPAHSIIGVDMMAEGFAQEDSSNKRKRAAEDNGDRDQKKVHIEDTSKLRIEDLHLDVGEKYLLCRTPHPRQKPQLTQDLFTLYSLNDVAKEVARTKPDGTKNGLRKSYKNHLKPISGAFDAVKKEEDAPDTLFALLTQPDDVWEANNVFGQEIGKGLGETVLAGMGQALKMAKGKIPKRDWNEAVLGPLSLQTAEAASTMQNGSRTPVPQNAATARPGMKGEIPRPKRNIKKRSYGDSSFEGYGEGFVDDDAQETGYSTGEGDDRGNRKRPKKTAPSHGYQSSMRQTSYDPRMVGV
ncbi:hypothetical protein HYFRA_00005276 [Hymenoscyphus fraxineus]|uniref:Mediator of RNA polymerase II transcription subunit 19 n=1 Tax=Hymenoscyphus fraxineus TaxID=746836 RepID=A0A9N9LCX8_9HELO|nr:hypothetical protein HYFRA_00005276 [Hymenoscyphus fraxineus]